MERPGRIAFVVLWIAAGILLLWVAIHQLDLARLTEHLTHTALPLLAVAALLDAVVALVKATKWHILLRAVGNAPIVRLLGAYYSGVAAATILPFRLDEFVRAYAAHRFTRLPGLDLLGSMALERLVDLVCLLLILTCLAWMLPLPPWLGTAIRVVLGIVVVLAAVLAALQIARSRGWGGGRVASLLAGLARGSQALLRPRLFAVGVAVTLAEWVVTVCVVHVVCVAVGVDLSWTGELLVVAMFMGSFATPLAPAGIGVFEVAMRLALPPLLGIPEETAVALALVVHAVLLLPVVVVGAVVIGVAGIRLQDVRRFRRETGEAAR